MTAEKLIASVRERLAKREVPELIVVDDPINETPRTPEETQRILDWYREYQERRGK